MSVKLGITKDIDFGVNGQLTTVSGTDKVRQMVYKALLTELGTNQFIPNYGSGISSIIGQKYDSLAEFTLYNSIQQAVQFLIDDQLNQFALPLSETIVNITSVGIQQDFNDPRVVRVTVEIQVASFDKATVTFNVVNA